jgi:tetratricopeptide (TPR) repeat protein
VFLLSVAGAAVAGWWYARESTPNPGPIVLITVDGLPAPSLAAYSGAATSSPALDALSADSVVFDRAYTHSPLTLPANASILSGRLPFEHGVRDNAGFALGETTRPIGELLRNRGFETGAAVSSFLLRPESGLARGFTYYEGGAETAAAAAEWIRSRRGYRFLLFVQVDPDSVNEAVSQIVTVLKDRNLYNQATILLTSDRADSADDVALTEASLRVPLIVKQPDRENAGYHVTVAVQHIDILPTILDLVRAPIPSGLQGRSLRGVLGGNKRRIPEQPIYAENLAARFRFGGEAHAVLINAKSGEIEQASVRALTAPSEIADEDADQFATFGNLPMPGAWWRGARTVECRGRGVDAYIHREAAMLASQRQYPAAVARLRQLVRARPDIAALHYQLGILLGRMERFDQADAAFRTATRLEPDNPFIPLARARMLLDARRLDAARDRAALAMALTEFGDPQVRAAASEVADRVALAQDDSASVTTAALTQNR